MEILRAIIEQFKPGSTETLGLAIGLMLGISLILLLRARQVWSHRRAFGYDVYTADLVRRRLMRWSLVGVLGIGLAVFAYRQYLRQQAEAEPEPVTVVDETGEGVETRLLIPRIAVDTTMIEAPLVGNHWDIAKLTDQVAHLAGTAYPGSPGNTVLAGHVTIPDAGWGPFKDLEALQPGDRIFIERGDETLIYVVQEAKKISPTNVQIAFPTNDERLTLLTCSGWSDELDDYEYRFAVIATRLH